MFLSSTVRDLADLRSAVKFWLEEFGFSVLASEWPDFPHALDQEATAAALSPIEDCDYSCSWGCAPAEYFRMASPLRDQSFAALENSSARLGGRECFTS